MNTLHRIHLLSLCIYIGGITSGVCLFVLIDKHFHIQLPVWILALIVLLCPVSSAILRLSIWKKKDEILSGDELTHSGTKVFVTIAYCEIIVAIIGAGILFL